MIEADYNFYYTTYGGSAPEEVFYRFKKRACIEVENLTFGRANSVTDEDTVERVKMAECAVVDELTRTENGVIVSASNDGYSETYQANRTAKQRLRDAALRYLALTGLMYQGGFRRC